MESHEEKIRIGLGHGHSRMWGPGTSGQRLEHAHLGCRVSHIHVQVTPHAHVEYVNPETGAVDEFVSYDEDPEGVIFGRVVTDSKSAYVVRAWVCVRKDCDKAGGWHFDIAQ